MLTVARATVPADAREAYLEAVQALAAAIQARGEHFWLFRNRSAPATYLEFHERADGPPDNAGEHVLRDRLRALATYSDDAAELWESVDIDRRP